ncbi:MAG: primosomal protein N', partial [Magnetospirillum sp. WYHS-4]
GPAVVKGLVDAGALRVLQVAARPPLPRPDWAHPGPTLSDAQDVAAADLAAKVADGFSVTLLDGVPGSGKTEVYFHAVAEALRRGRQVLVLLPEIALTAQWLDRFRDRFGAPPAVWHSDLAMGLRRQTWRAVAEGRAGVVVGARSALFLPFANLGLVVVDEEHDAAFKQEEVVIYNARDMAVVRARLGEIPVVLASATPSLETVVNVRQGRYGLSHLPDRHAGAELPGVALIDLIKAPPPRGHWLSPPLVDALKATFALGEQAMLFLNRRGYAPLTLCRACGHRFQCPRCTAWLVEHRQAKRLLCHHCGHAVRMPERCPSCQAEDSLAACGPGVERLGEEVARLFPDVRHLIAASDTVTGPKAAAELVRRIEDHEVDLVVGTQIVAKGYHFPMLTLVGVVDADLGLEGGDLRAAERTFQLLYQVAGRAGRAQRPGRVLLQTTMPNHAVMQALAAGDRERFLEVEAKGRQEAGMPPFGRLAALIVSGEELSAVEAVARALGRAAPREEGIQVLGPAPAPLALLRGRHRYRLLLKARKDVNVQAVLQAWLAAVPHSRKLRVQVDVDPYSFL